MSKNKRTIAKLKGLSKQAIKMLNNLGLEKKLVELKQVKKNYFRLRRDKNSVLSGEDELSKNNIKKFKKSNNKKDHEFVNLVLKLENKDRLFEKDSCIPARTIFVEQKSEIGRSTLYSFDSPFQLLYADATNFEFLGKLFTDPIYCLVFVNLFASKVYTYSMKSRRFITKKCGCFIKR